MAVPATHPEPRCPVIDFDHHAPPSEMHVWDASRELRESCPVGWSERYGGHWVVTKYDDVRRVMGDFETFTARRLGDPQNASFLVPAIPFPLVYPAEFDPPDNRRYRRRLNEILSRAAVRPLEPRIRHWTNRCLDGVIESGACDLALDIATPVPALVSLEWLGMPDDVGQRGMLAWHEYLGYPQADPRSERGWADVEWLNERIREELELRREKPQDDVLSFLVHQEFDGETLEFDEVVGMTKILVAAGIDTTTNGIAWGLLHLSRHPEHRLALRDNPELWDTAVDELLRRYPPVTSHARTATRDVELGGCHIRAGDKVLAFESSACHDGDVFDNPLDVVLDRRPNQHVAFGTGTHRCAGLHLARLELRTVLAEVVDRLPDYRIDECTARQYPDQGNVAGWQSLPATFTPGSRREDT